MSYKSISILSLLAISTNALAADPIAPTLEGTYSSICQLSSAGDEEEEGPAFTMSFTVSGDKMKLEKWLFEDSLCSVPKADENYRFKFLTYTIGKYLGEVDGFGNFGLTVKFDDVEEDGDEAEESCFSIRPTLLKDKKEIFYMGELENGYCNLFNATALLK